MSSRQSTGFDQAAIAASAESDPRTELKLEWTRTYFDHDSERHAKQHSQLDAIFDTRPIRAGAATEIERDPRPIPDRLQLPATQARYLSVAPLAIDRDQLLSLLGTRGLLVLHDDRIVHEEYLHGHDESTRWMTNSASKLVVGMLVARARDDGHLRSFDDPVGAYWPEAADTAWAGVTVGQCMAMTTGVDFVEESLDLDDPANQFRQLFHELAFGSVERFLLSLGRRAEPGTELVYSSIDTEALGSVVPRAVGMGIAQYLEQTIWQPAGMEADAFWLCDPTGRELALSGLCATLRDYGRLGLILQHSGQWNGTQILPSAFTDGLSSPDPASFELPGHDDYPLMCWQQSFVPSTPDEQRGDYMAAGSYGQLIYVDPASRVVVAHQGIGRDITTEYIDMHRAFMAFRQIAASLTDAAPHGGRS
jgi:CubicO group peptidase (beta-lactamase class C family)